MAKNSKKQPKSTSSFQSAVTATAWYERPALVAGLLAVFGFFLYAQTLSYGFVLDDSIVITSNVITQKGVAGWGELFSHDTFFGFFQDETKAQLVSGGRYRPLSLALFGLEATISSGPFIHHFFNLLWYGGLLAMLYLFLLEITRHRQAQPDQWTYLLPLIATALFAAHPLHTEVVANIKGRDEIMALAGSVGAAWLVWRAADRNSLKLATLAAVVFFLGLLSKENTITFLAVIPLMLYALRRDFSWSQLKFAAPLFVSAMVFLIIRQSVIGSGSGNEILELMNNPFVKLESGRWVAFSFSEWSASVVYGLGYYLKLILLPLSLSHDYYPRAVEVMQWGDWRVLLSLVANVGLLIWGLLQLGKRPWIGVGVLMYFLTLSIVSNVFFPVGTNVSERFLFMPSLGFSLVLAGGLWRLQSSNVFKNSRVLAGVVMALLLAYSLRTVLRNPVWKDNYTLFTTDVVNQPRSAKLQNAAAGSKVDYFQTLPESSRPANRKLLTEALGHLTQALEIHPTYKNAYLLRGNAHFLLDEYDAAIAAYDQALELDPGYTDAINNLRVALQRGGRYFGEQKNDLNKSRALLQRALTLDGNDYETLRLLGVLNGVAGQQAEALKYFKRAAEVNPNDGDALWNLGTAYYQLGELDQASQAFARAKQVDPGIEARRQGQ